jgi:hypothetical protein
MNAYSPPEVGRETDQAKESRGNRDLETVPQEVCSHEQTPPRSRGGLSVPDGGASETFIGGAGI